jgi:predicted DNA binding CopG/RHH family protein
MLFRYIVQSQKLTQKVQDTLDEDKLKKMAISDYKKKKTEIDTNFRVQQNLCEAVQRDRNTLNKQLLQAQVKQC